MSTYDIVAMVWVLGETAFACFCFKADQAAGGHFMLEESSSGLRLFYMVCCVVVFPIAGLIWAFAFLCRWLDNQHGSR